MELAVLCLAAFLASILSAVVGMAGGIVLLTVMLLYFEPLIAIPLHGVIQLVSNGSRTVIQRAHVRWDLVWRYAILLLPMAYVGLSAARALSPELARTLIGVFVLLATWRPGWLTLGTHPEQTQPRQRFVVLGGAMGFLQMNIGATGPLIAPFFLNLGLTRQALVGSKAAVQTLGHVTKILLFGAFGFAFSEYGLLLVSMCALVVLGAWIGSRLLEHVNERVFTWLFKSVLTLIAVRLVLWDGWALVRGG